MPINMKKLLVTGASGFLGWNICNESPRDWSVFGTVFSHHINIPGTNIIRSDLTDFKDIKEVFKRIRPEAVIHTAAAADPGYCQENRAEAWKINVDASINIAGLCSDYGIPCVFTSTDMVFNGLNPPYREKDPVSPINIYGEQKALAEEGLLKRYPDAAVCRMALMFGNAGPVSSTFFQTMMKALREGRELRLFVDEFRTPLSGKSAVGGLMMALEKVRGLIHLGGIERISRYDFGLLIMEVLGIRKAGLVRCRQKEVAAAAPRAPDVSLDSSKAAGSGFKPLSLRRELERILGKETS